MRQRKKPKHLIVWIPGKRWICHALNVSTYIEVLKWIGGERASKAGLEISHLPIVTKEPYPRFAKYMKPIGDGWYVNTVGGTSNKYMRLCSINDKLKLGMTVRLLDKDPFNSTDRTVLSDFWSESDFDIGKRRTRKVSGTLIVEYKDLTVFFRKRDGQELFCEVIEKIGVKEVYKLGLKTGQHDLVTRMKVYDNQIPCGDFWLTVPNGTKYKYKILLTIKALLKLDMKATLPELS